jgi:hypothetical protein
MKSIAILLTSMIGFSMPITKLSLDDIVSVIRLSDGSYDVLCKDHRREIVSKHDLMNDNVCPHNPNELPSPREKHDILLVVDNSGSMESSQSSLLVSAKAMIDDLQARSIDFQIGIATTDAYRTQFLKKSDCSVLRDGPLNSSCARLGKVPYSGVRIIDNFTQDIQNVFLTNFKQTVPEYSLYGNGDERAFMSIQNVFSNSENSSFLRADSFLHVVIVSDEDDFSHPDPVLNENYENADLVTINDMVEYLDHLTKSSPLNRRYKVSAIAIFDRPCLDELNTTFSGRKIGQRYGQLVDATGGEKVSLCAPAIPYRF